MIAADRNAGCCEDCPAKNVGVATVYVDERFRTLCAGCYGARLRLVEFPTVEVKA